MSKKIGILGATGSVGVSTLKVVEAMPDRFRVVLLTAHRAKETLLAQALRHRPEAVAIGSAEDRDWLRQRLDPKVTRVVSGTADLEKLVADTRVDLMIAAIVGAAGLKPTLAAIRAGADIGLANKESMVVAGAFVNRAVEAAGIRLLPIDSEHNALHQCLRGEKLEEVKRLILTASGGPFRSYEGDFDKITPEQALKHPTWEMGRKISIDSATLMNKGLEVIEAHHLFGFPADRIDIVVHPQSAVHSMIETVDGSYLCQLGRTDMCDPILYALTYPERRPNPFGGIDITRGIELSFHPVDMVRFPCVQLAYDALAMGASAPAVLNAANEVAVHAFLDHRLSFPGIAEVNRACLDRFGGRGAHDLEEVLDNDRQSRTYAEEMVAARSI